MSQCFSIASLSSIFNYFGSYAQIILNIKNCFREQFEEVSSTDKKRPTTPAPTHENLEDQRLKKSFKLKNLGNFNSRYSRNSITSFYCFRPVEEFYLLDESKIWSRVGKKYRGLAQTEKQTSI